MSHRINHQAVVNVTAYTMFVHMATGIMPDQGIIGNIYNGARKVSEEMGFGDAYDVPQMDSNIVFQNIQLGSKAIDIGGHDP